MRRTVGAFTCVMAIGVVVALEQAGLVPRSALPAVTDLYIPSIYSSAFHEPSAIGTKEDPQARAAYLMRMQADPVTGVVPEGIRSRETVYARKLLRRADKTAAARKHSLQWTSAGPANVGGRTRALAVDIRSEDIVIAGGVSGGIWRSENGGRDWEKRTHPQSLHSVTCIVQNTMPGMEDHWYYGTGEIKGNSAGRKAAPFRGDGIFHSSDNGRTWVPLASTVQGEAERFNNQFQYVSDLCFVPDHAPGGALYAACVGAIFRSVDGGSSWSAVLGRDLRFNQDRDLNGSNLSRYSALAEGPEGLLFALLSQEGIRGTSPERGVFRSSDGSSWTSITPAFWPGRYGRGVMGVSGSVPGVMYMYLNANEEMIWRYRFDAVTGRWDDLTENRPAFGEPVGELNSQDSYNMVVGVHPRDEQTVYIGGTNLYRSVDGFETTENTTWIGGYDTANNVSKFPNHFVDQHALVFMRSDPDMMLCANDGGVFFTRNNRAPMPSWQSLNAGYRTSQFFTIGVDAYGSSDRVLAGMMDNGAYAAESPLESTRWTALLGGDGAYCGITRSGQYYYASTQNSRIFRLTLNGSLEYTTFTRVDPTGAGTSEGQEYLFVNPFVLAPENQNVMYLAGGDRLWRNENLSQIPSFSNEPTHFNWLALPDTRISSGQISALEASVNPAGVVYYGTTDGRIFRLDSARSDDPPVRDITSVVFPREAYVASIAIDPADADHAVVAFSNYGVQSVFATFDGGHTFSHVGGNLEEYPDGRGNGPSVRWITIVPLQGGGNLYFAGTSTGLYATEQLAGGAPLWVQESPEVIGNVVVTMMQYRAHDQKIYVATHGNGSYAAIVEGGGSELPLDDSGGLELGPSHPNPTSNGTTIPYIIPEDGMVRIAIYDYTGRIVRIILWAHQFAGRSTAYWDGTNEAGAPVRPGVYIARLEYNGRSASVRIVVQ